MKKYIQKIKTFVQSRFSSWRAAAGAVCLLAFLVLIILEILVINSSIHVMLSGNDLPPDFKQSKGVRVDFASYVGALGRIQGAEKYEPGPQIRDNPFRLPPSAKRE